MESLHPPIAMTTTRPSGAWRRRAAQPTVEWACARVRMAFGPVVMRQQIALVRRAIHLVRLIVECAEPSLKLAKTVVGRTRERVKGRASALLE